MSRAHTSLPVLASRQTAMSRLPRLHMVKARSPTTAKEENPSPSGTFHSTFGGVFSHVVLMAVSGAMPLRCGPRNCGHHGLASLGPAAATGPDTTARSQTLKGKTRGSMDFSGGRTFTGAGDAPAAGVPKGRGSRRRISGEEFTDRGTPRHEL